MVAKKSVISLISYDAEYLPQSVSSYIEFVDEIILGLDENRITWSNNKFSFDEGKLWSELQAIDKEKKIKIIEGNFHKSGIPLENDNYERNFLKSHCTNDWIFSFDSDEVLLNAKDFFYKWCPIVEPYMHKVDILFSWMLPFKEFENEFLVIADNNDRWFKGDTQGIGTVKNNTYTYCRWTNQKRMVMSPLVALHWSFCRTQENLQIKLNNFGHSDKTKSDPFFSNWSICNLDNYTLLRDFKTSGFGTNQWNKLIKVNKRDFMQIANMEAKSVY